MKENLLMFVYNDLKFDSRVIRSLDSLSRRFNIDIISTGTNKFESSEFHNIKIIRNNNKVIKFVKFVLITLFYSMKKKYKIIYGHDYYSTFTLMVTKFFARRKAKFIYDAHELIVNGERKSYKNNIFVLIEKKIIRSVDLVVAASDDRALIMKNHYNLETLPLVIPNISLLKKDKESDINQNEDLSPIFDFTNTNNTVIVYIGVMSYVRKLDLLIENFSVLSQEYKLLLIGNGPDFSKISKRINNLDEKIKNRIALFPSIPYVSIYNVLVKCDIGYLAYPNKGLNNIYCAPNKVYEYASVGLPMVTFYNFTLSKIFNKYKIGVSQNNIIHSIEKVSKNYNEFFKNINIFLSVFQWQEYKEKLESNVSCL